LTKAAKSSPINQVVLLLDDEESIRRDLGGRLRSQGYNVHTANSAEDARKIILSEKIDCAIVDLKIDWHSEFSGAAVVNFLKRNRPKARAVVLSAYALDDRIRANFEVEIDGYVEKGGTENYITSVLSKLNNLSKIAAPKKCFVVMPFSTTATCTEQEWAEIFGKLIKPAVERSGHGYLCERSAAHMGNIIEDVLDSLNRADIVIADMTDRNPNVFYELGVRHALRNSTILIAQNLADIPFDLRPYATHEYRWRLEADRKLFLKRIREIIDLIETEPDKAVSPVRRYLKM
jgi:response regulator RpfG family c-di-GMP phosphodiesterase